jgi:hypothetical protein
MTKDALRIKESNRGGPPPRRYALDRFEASFKVPTSMGSLDQPIPGFSREKC